MIVKKELPDKIAQQLNKAGFGHVVKYIKKIETNNMSLAQMLTKSEIVKADLIRECEQHENDIRDLECIKFTRFNDDECWIFQDDGEDYLESLVCPVVLSKDKLIDLLSYREQFRNQQQTQPDNVNNVNNTHTGDRDI